MGWGEASRWRGLPALGMVLLWPAPILKECLFTGLIGWRGYWDSVREHRTFRYSIVRGFELFAMGMLDYLMIFITCFTVKASEVLSSGWLRRSWLLRYEMCFCLGTIVNCLQKAYSGFASTVGERCWRRLAYKTQLRFRREIHPPSLPDFDEIAARICGRVWVKNLKSWWEYACGHISVLSLVSRLSPVTAVVSLSWRHPNWGFLIRESCIVIKFLMVLPHLIA